MQNVGFPMMWLNLKKKKKYIETHLKTNRSSWATAIFYIQNTDVIPKKIRKTLALIECFINAWPRTTTSNSCVREQNAACSVDIWLR